MTFQVNFYHSIFQQSAKNAIIVLKSDRNDRYFLSTKKKIVTLDRSAYGESISWIATVWKSINKRWASLTPIVKIFSFNGTTPFCVDIYGWKYVSENMKCRWTFKMASFLLKPPSTVEPCTLAQSDHLWDLPVTKPIILSTKGITVFDTEEK